MKTQKTFYKCDICIHYNGQYTGTCKAFPKGIPFIISMGQISHIKPYKGDRGIQFEKSKDGKIKEHIFT